MTLKVLKIDVYEKYILSPNHYKIIDHGRPNEYSNGIYNYKCNTIWIEILDDKLLLNEKN